MPNRLLRNCFAAGKKFVWRLILVEYPTIEKGASRFVTNLEGPPEFFSTLLAHYGPLQLSLFGQRR